MTKITRNLPNNGYNAVANASEPSALNPFATVNELQNDITPLTGIWAYKSSIPSMTNGVFTTNNVTPSLVTSITLVNTPILGFKSRPLPAFPTYHIVNLINPLLEQGFKFRVTLTSRTNVEQVHVYSLNGSLLVTATDYIVNLIYIGSIYNVAFVEDDEYIVTFSMVGEENGYDFSFAVSDETSDITTGTDKITLFAPRKFRLIQAKATLTTAGSTDTTIDIKANGVSIFDTIITIDSADEKSVDSLTPCVLSAIFPPVFLLINEDDKITVDVVSAGTGAKGLKIYLKGHA